MRANRVCFLVSGAWIVPQIATFFSFCRLHPWFLGAAIVSGAVFGACTKKISSNDLLLVPMVLSVAGICLSMFYSWFQLPGQVDAVVFQGMLFFVAAYAAKMLS